MTPGAKFSTSTSARLTISISRSRPCGFFRSSETELLVRVEHRERKRCTAHHAAAAQVLAALRFDLDHVGAGLRHQEGRVGAVVDLGEIHNLDPVQRVGRRRIHLSGP